MSDAIAALNKAIEDAKDECPGGMPLACIEEIQKLFKAALLEHGASVDASYEAHIDSLIRERDELHQLRHQLEERNIEMTAALHSCIRVMAAIIPPGGPVDL